MEYLHQHYLFTHLEKQQFSELAKHTAEIELSEQEHLFRQQQPARFFYLVVEGQIKLYRLSPNGEEKVIELIAPGQTFAEAVMFMHGGAYPVNAQAINDSRLVRIEMARFRKLLEQSPQTCLKILGHMSQRLHGAIQEIDQLTLQNARMRVIQFLLREVPGDYIGLYQTQWLTPKSVLASRLSIRPETFSRLLQQLSQEQLISIEGKNITLLNVESLRNNLME